ncbi:MAG: serine hydrolase domain-containing protein [Chthoniobacterales bacterium]
MKIILRLCLIMLALVAWAVLVFFGTIEGWWKRPLAPRGDTAAFAQAATKFINDQNKGNAALALLDHGSVTGEHALSVGAPVDTNTVFQVASLSKWITAWGVMALVDQGKLDLDAPVGRYLKRWKLPASQFENDGVTARRLLSHTAGLADGLGYAGFPPGMPVQTLEESLTKPADASPGASGLIQVAEEPGRKWKYSGGGYAILQLLVEDISGEPFEDFMQRTVLQPLGMSHSSFVAPPADVPVAVSYDTNSQPAILYRFAALAPTSLYTTVADLTRFLQAHIPGKDGAPSGRGVLAPATVQEIWQPHAEQFGVDVWGLGTMLFAPNNSGGYIIGHDGKNEPAINTTARLNPATGNGIIILETGAPLLATRLAGEWVVWETGKLDFLAVAMALPRMLRVIGVGALVIVATCVAFWLWRRKTRAIRVQAALKIRAICVIRG